MSVPATMRFIDVRKYGKPEVMFVNTCPVPAPKADEVLIRVMAAGVNRPDCFQREGNYPPPPGASTIMGLECAGEVVAIGADVTRFKIGDRVCGLANGGAYAEYCAIPQTQTLRWPTGMDAVTAAAICETFFTVYVNTFTHGRLKPGETFLVHGGTSGIGSAAIMLGREFGATVYATAGAPDKLEACLKLGATAAFSYKTQDWSKEVLAATGKRGVDVVLDLGGGPYLQKNLQCLAMDGRIVCIAFLAGVVVDGVNLGLLAVKRAVVTGSTMRPRTTAQKGEIAQDLEARVWPVLDQGRCWPVINKVFAFEDIAQAHTLMETNTHIGKIVVKIAD